MDPLQQSLSFSRLSDFWDLYLQILQVLGMWFTIKIHLFETTKNIILKKNSTFLPYTNYSHSLKYKYLYALEWKFCTEIKNIYVLNM